MRSNNKHNLLLAEQCFVRLRPGDLESFITTLLPPTRKNLEYLEHRTLAETFNMCIYTATYNCGHTVRESLPCYQCRVKSKWGNYLRTAVKNSYPLLTRCPNCLFPRNRTKYDRARDIYPEQSRRESQKERLGRLSIPILETISEEPQLVWDDPRVEALQMVPPRTLYPTPSHSSFRVLRKKPSGLRFRLRSKLEEVRESFYELRYSRFVEAMKGVQYIPSLPKSETRAEKKFGTSGDLVEGADPW